MLVQCAEAFILKAPVPRPLLCVCAGRKWFCCVLLRMSWSRGSAAVQSWWWTQRPASLWRTRRSLCASCSPPARCAPRGLRCSTCSRTGWAVKTCASSSTTSGGAPWPCCCTAACRSVPPRHGSPSQRREQ